MFFLDNVEIQNPIKKIAIEVAMIDWMVLPPPMENLHVGDLDTWLNILRRSYSVAMLESELVDLEIIYGNIFGRFNDIYHISIYNSSSQLNTAK